MLVALLTLLVGPALAQPYCRQGEKPPRDGCRYPPFFSGFAADEAGLGNRNQFMVVLAFKKSHDTSGDLAEHWGWAVPNLDVFPRRTEPPWRLPRTIRDNLVILSFFAPQNPEVMVKILDGCRRNGHWWIYISGTTDLPYRVYIYDLDNRRLGGGSGYDSFEPGTRRVLVDTATMRCYGEPGVHSKE